MNMFSLPWSLQPNQGFAIGPLESPRSQSGTDDGHYKWREGCVFDRSTEFPRGRYRGQQILGSGTYGKVFQCLDQKHNVSNAVKIVRKGVRGFREAALKELDILQHLDGHQGTVKLLRSFEHDGHICMSFDLLGPSLKKLLESRSGEGWSRKEIPDIVRQLLVAMEYIHGKGIIHTDFKTDNVLLVPNSANVKQIKVIDFGSAIFATDSHNPVIGTNEYRSPEAILQAGWSYPTDMWSLGCIIAEMYCGKPLFCLCPEDVHLELMRKVLGKSIPLSMISRGYANSNQYNCNLITCDPTGLPRLKTVAKLVSASSVPKVERIISDPLLLNLVQSMLEYEPAGRITAKTALQRLLCSQLSKVEDILITETPRTESQKSKYPSPIISRRPNSHDFNSHPSEEVALSDDVDNQKPRHKVRFEGPTINSNGSTHQPGKIQIVDPFFSDNVEIEEVVDDIHEQITELLDEVNDSDAVFRSPNHPDRNDKQISPDIAEFHTIQNDNNHGKNEDFPDVGYKLDAVHSAESLNISSFQTTRKDNGSEILETDKYESVAETKNANTSNHRLKENAHASKQSPYVVDFVENDLIPKRSLENALKIHEMEVNGLREELKQLQDNYTTVKQQLLDEFEARKDEAEQVESKLEQIKSASRAEHDAEMKERDLELRIVKESLKESIPTTVHKSEIYALKEEIKNMIPKSTHMAHMSASNEELESKQKTIDSLTFQNTIKQEEIERYLDVIQKMNEEHGKIHKLTMDMMVPKELYEDKVASLSATIQTLQTSLDAANSRLNAQKAAEAQIDSFGSFLFFVEQSFSLDDNEVRSSIVEDLAVRMERIRRLAPKMVPLKTLEDSQNTAKAVINRLQQRSLDMAARMHGLEEEKARLDALNTTLIAEFSIAVEEHSKLMPSPKAQMEEELHEARRETSRLQNRMIEMAHCITALKEDLAARQASPQSK